MSDPKHFEENDLMSRDIPSLDRILEIYFAKANRKISDEKEIISFYLNLLIYMEKRISFISAFR